MTSSSYGLAPTRERQRVINFVRTMHSGPRRTLNISRHSRSKLAAACLDDDGNMAFEDTKPDGSEWTETACETAGGTFKAGLQRSDIECACSIRS